MAPSVIRWYGLLFALGFVIGQRILTKIYVAEGRTEGDVDVITMYMIIGTVLGARLGHVLFYDPVYYLSNPSEILKIWEGDWPAMELLSVSCWRCGCSAASHRFDYMWVLDRIVIVVALGGALIRLGNLMNSEIFGRPTDVPWAFIFVQEQLSFRMCRAIPRSYTNHWLCFLLFVVLYWLMEQVKVRLPRGLLFGLFVTVPVHFAAFDRVPEREPGGVGRPDGAEHGPDSEHSADPGGAFILYRSVAKSRTGYTRRQAGKPPQGVRYNHYSFLNAASWQKGQPPHIEGACLFSLSN